MNIEINSIAELSIDELEKLEKKEKINRITVLGHHKTSVSPRDYKRIYRKMQELTDGIQQDWSRTKKFVLIYRRISRNIVYDYAAAYPEGAIQAVYSEKETDNCRNLKNGLLQGKCVCAGYAEILRNACLLKGVPAIEIDGPAGNGNHAWNQVEIDNKKWIEVDPTWDHKSGTRYIGTNKEQFLKKHGRYYDTVGSLIESNEQEISNFDLTAFINEEFGLDMQYSPQEQNDFIALLDMRDTQGLDIGEQLNELIERVKLRTREEQEFEQECGYTIHELTELGFTEDEIETMQANFDEKTGEKVNRREVVHQYVENKSKQKLKEQEFEQECGYTMEQLADFGFTEEEISSMQAKFDSQTGIRINRREVVERKIAEKNEKSTNEPTVTLTEEEKENLKLQCQNLHPQVLKIIIKEIEAGYIPFEDACLIIEYIKGNETRDKANELQEKRVKLVQESYRKIFENECGYTIEQLLQMGFSKEEIENLQINYDSRTGIKLDRKKIVEEAIRKKYNKDITLQEVGKGTVESFKKNVQRALKTAKDFFIGVVRMHKSKDKDIRGDR